VNKTEIRLMKRELLWAKLAAFAAGAAAVIFAVKAHNRARKVEQQIDKEIRRLLTERPPGWAGVGTTGGGQGIP
jgi:hypothetical protein